MSTPEEEEPLQVPGRRGLLVAMLILAVLAGVAAGAGIATLGSSDDETSSGSEEIAADAEPLAPAGDGAAQDQPDTTVPWTGPPNVLVVMTDDQTVEQMRWLPSVQRFMTSGTEYVNSITNYPLCGPSRATFLLGQYANTHGMRCNRGLAAQFNRVEADSLAPWVQAQGVHTIHVGKYLNGYGGEERTRYIPAGWDDWRTLAGSSAFNYLRFDMVINGEFVRYGRQGETAYQTDVLADQLDDALRVAPTDRPFFAVFTPLAPHFQIGENRDFAIPAPRHEDTIDDVLRPPNYDACEVRDAPCAPEGSDLRPGPLDEARKAIVDNAYQTTSESLLAVDEAFQRIVDTLAELGRLEHTVVIFTSDNGFMFGEHGIPQGKKVPTRESLFVPLLIAGPGFEAGQETAPVTNADLAPTIVDIFDAQPTLALDGQSLLEELSPDRALLIEAKPQAGTRGYTGTFADGWLYIDWEELDRNELYAPDDVLQLQNLDDDPAFDAIESELGQLTAELLACRGEACRIDWTAPGS
ncbi:MAG: sulfatase-like hydrolase/transferase [Actinomycetota bacterium]